MSDTPLEPFAVFYAALVLLGWCRNIRAGAGDVKLEEQQEEQAPRFSLDRPMDRSDGELQAWIYGGSTGAGGAWVEEVGALDAEGAGVRVLRVAARRLVALKVWRVGELLGRTLVELAREEESRAAGAGAGAGGSTLGGGEEEGVKAEAV